MLSTSLIRRTMSLLQGDARTAALAKLDGWAEADGRDAIVKKFQFNDFSQVAFRRRERAIRRAAAPPSTFLTSSPCFPGRPLPL